MKRMITIAFAAVLAVAACGKKNDTPPAPAPPPPAGSATAGSGSAMAGSGSAAMTGSGSAAAAVDVPTEMDFEQQAKTDVTDKTVEAKVKAIEDQLGQ